MVLGSHTRITISTIVCWVREDTPQGMCVYFWIPKAANFGIELQ